MDYTDGSGYGYDQVSVAPFPSYYKQSHDTEYLAKQSQDHSDDIVKRLNRNAKQTQYDSYNNPHALSREGMIRRGNRMYTMGNIEDYSLSNQFKGEVGRMQGHMLGPVGAGDVHTGPHGHAGAYGDGYIPHSPCTHQGTCIYQGYPYQNISYGHGQKCMCNATHTHGGAMIVPQLAVSTQLPVQPPSKIGKLFDSDILLFIIIVLVINLMVTKWNAASVGAIGSPASASTIGGTRIEGTTSTSSIQSIPQGLPSV